MSARLGEEDLQPRNTCVQGLSLSISRRGSELKAGGTDLQLLLAASEQFLVLLLGLDERFLEVVGV